MRVIHVVPSIAEEASGPSYSVVRLCEALTGLGEAVTLAATDFSPLPSAAPSCLKLFPLGVGPRRLGRSPEMHQWLVREASSGQIDVIHNHGMWQMNAVYPGWAARGGRGNLVVSPRGAFSTWAMSHGSRLKRVMWPMLQRPAIARAACFHATAETECADIRRLGFAQPVAVIPNGVDIPACRQRSSAAPRTLLFLGRIHPKKGVDILLHAWAAVMESFDDWRLLIVGSDRGYGATGGHLERMKALAASLHLKRTSFAEPLYGEAKWTAYRNADLFVLPSHSENFGMAVAESLASGTPAIVSRGAPWEGLDVRNAGWWVEAGLDPLVSALNYAMSRSRNDLEERGANGRRWMMDEFSWAMVAERMHVTYEWLGGTADQPVWVRTT